MRPFLPSLKTLFVGFGLALAAVGAQAQTVSIAGGLSVHAEGNAASTTRTITLTKTGAAATVLSFGYFGTATYAATFPANTPGDYTFSGPGIVITGPSTGTMAFPTGNTVRTITVTVRGDTTHEVLDVEDAFFQFFSATNAYTLLGDTFSITQITGSQDTQPTLSWSYSAQSETIGTAALSVSLSNRSDQAVTFTAATSNAGCTPSGCTAIAGPAPNADYTPASAGLVIPAYGLTTSLSVPMIDDLLNEGNESFRAELTSIVNASPGNTHANVIITDNDPIPTVSIGADQSFIEGNSGSISYNFPVTLSAPSGRVVLVQASTGGGTATGGNNDYLGISGNLSFAPGETVKNYSVSINGDTALETDETFFVNIAAQSNVANGADLQALGTIQNDDSPALSINDPIADEDIPGTLTFTVSIPSPAPASGIGFTYEASSLACVPACTATSGSDYTAAGPIVVTGTSGGILAGTTSVAITIPVSVDTDPEGNETFKVTLSLPTGSGATILDNTGVGTIVNDDLVPAGDLVISEFRLSGPGGDTDEFVEIANTTSADINVFTTDGSGGYAVAHHDGVGGGTLVFVIPNGTTIPARGHYLAAAPAYTLSNYGGTSAGSPDDLPGPADDWQAVLGIPENTGLALFTSATTFTAPNRLDSVGFAGGDFGTIFIEPVMCAASCGLPSISRLPGNAQYSIVRKYAYGGGSLQDEDLPATGSKEDFVVVAVNAAFYGTAQSVLGGPSPENTAAETERSADFTIASPDGGYQIFQPTMAGVPPKVMEFRRTFTNNVAATTAMRFKITNLTGVNSGLGAGVLELRPVTSSQFVGASTTVYHGVTLEGSPDIPTEPLVYTVTTPAGVAPVSGPGTARNGGLNSSLRLDLVAAGFSPLPLGTPVGVNFRSEYRETGSFYYWVAVQSK